MARSKAERRRFGDSSGRSGGAYRAFIDSDACETIRHFDDALRKAVGRKIRQLQNDPYPDNRDAIEGEAGLYRVRVAKDWRILYFVDDRARTISIEDIGHRSDVYRNRSR